MAGRWRYLPRLVGLVWQVDARLATLVLLLQATWGLYYVAQVHLVRRLVETAQQVVAGSAPLAAGLAWGGALAGLGLGGAGLLAALRLADNRHQELLRAAVEERCCRQAQSIPLEQLEVAEHYDRLERARRGLDQRLSRTTSLLWSGVSEVVALVSLLAYLGQFHWGLPLLLVVATTRAVYKPRGLTRYGRRRQGRLRTASRP